MFLIFNLFIKSLCPTLIEYFYQFLSIPCTTTTLEHLHCIFSYLSKFLSSSMIISYTMTSKKSLYHFISSLPGVIHYVLFTWLDHKSLCHASIRKSWKNSRCYFKFRALSFCALSSLILFLDSFLLVYHYQHYYIYILFD